MDCAVQAFLETLDSWTNCGLQSSQMSPYPEFRSCARVPSQFTQQDSLVHADHCWNVKTSNIPVHQGILLVAVRGGVKRRTILYTCYFPGFLLDVFVKSAQATASGGVLAKTSSWSPHVTRCAAILVFHSLLSMSCSHLDRAFLRGFGFTQHAHFRTSSSLVL